MRRSKRAGFTLFQLLIVLAVLMILAGLLLPAIQKARGASARIQSQNNLKQLALATINYADAMNGTMPSGVDDKKYSVLFHILPYIEQENVWKTADRTKDMDDKANAKVREVHIKTYMSPLDPVAGPNPKWGPTNYMGNAGTKAGLADNDGVLYKDSSLKYPASITDGTSNTILFIETLKGDGGKTAVSVARQHVRLGQKELKGIKEDAGVKDFKADKHIAADRGASWMDGRFLQATINGMLKLNDDRPDVDCAGEGGVSGARTLGSTTNVGLCDGSVRSVSTSISLVTWQAACTAAGGEILGADW
jgi:type II secretory pathway pseudopilin PulG